MKSFISLLVTANLLLAVSVTQAQNIFHAATNNDLEKVKVIIQKDASAVNSKDETDNTPLHIAAMIGTAIYSR